MPDERFRPLVIVMNPDWKKNLPGYIQTRFEGYLKMTPDSVAGTEMHVVAAAYITEFGLRHYMGYRALSDDVYDALRARIIAAWDEARGANDKDNRMRCVDEVHKGMMRIEDGDVLVDFQKNSGPFYCDGLIAIEHHFQKSLQRVAR